jgi:ABC-type enterochelin transport system substrate-binding protein
MSWLSENRVMAFVVISTVVSVAIVFMRWQSSQSAITPSLSHVLDNQYLVVQVKAAEAGDAAAASRIGLHMRTLGHYGCAEQWYRLAKKNGADIAEEAIRAVNPELRPAESTSCAPK